LPALPDKQKKTSNDVFFKNYWSERQDLSLQPPTIPSLSELTSPSL
jgi:hypothetical protein